ncbi:M15 family metallopeptidase [Variovorax paradoxus]|uniref:M15 family metallopeptidase n=1 Tax=Variovorax paradoxus TaxID=34073 RepID=UPI0029C71537|nr:M15 family metallopeptidase [Variovorax paradoxus]WPH18232.1 M15 family metallopeptidase [Variovorax paradoxus]
MILNARSHERLKGVHADLVKVVELCASNGRVNFQVSEGLRTAARQAELVRAGKSQTQNSRHLTGHAVDLVVLNPDGSANWDFTKYIGLHTEMALAADALKVSIEWGGNWRSLRDGPHWQLPFNKYPK